MSGHDVPPGWEHGRPVIPPGEEWLPEEFHARREGARVGNVLETDGAAAAADAERRTR
ncbi:hypothetical protein GCM10009527_098040 [Actinomadura nitritigenes]|uniref:Uncharacterized protein n=1 Tax=Actinomadura nitritigenes TaxID=134602 RepID=A0ABS3QWD2_9ACTN|nr:hypothetical protein [Actinomadura nitritigenes]MBO2438288.1 hypothetical protein [Actinomadura nitritigenes]